MRYIEELWDVYDKHGNLTGSMKKENEVFFDNEYHLVASLWVVNAKGELLIQKRSMSKKIHPGKWSITGGAARAGEDSGQACVREVAEELGINIDKRNIRLFSRIFGENVIFDDYIIFLNLSLSDVTLQDSEVTEIKWASIKEVKALFKQGQFIYDDEDELDRLEGYIREIFPAGG